MCSRSSSRGESGVHAGGGQEEALPRRGVGAVEGEAPCARPWAHLHPSAGAPERSGQVIAWSTLLPLLSQHQTCPRGFSRDPGTIREPPHGPSGALLGISGPRTIGWWQEQTPKDTLSPCPPPLWPEPGQWVGIVGRFQLVVRHSFLRVPAPQPRRGGFTGSERCVPGGVQAGVR